jgi:hypothetical protein
MFDIVTAFRGWQLACTKMPICSLLLCQTEVNEDASCTLRVVEEVGGLDVAVEDPVSMDRT